MSVDRLCHRQSVATVQDAVTRLYRCVVEMKMKAAFKNGCGLSKGAESIAI